MLDFILLDSFITKGPISLRAYRLYFSFIVSLSLHMSQNNCNFNNYYCYLNRLVHFSFVLQLSLVSHFSSAPCARLNWQFSVSFKTHLKSLYRIVFPSHDLIYFVCTALRSTETGATQGPCSVVVLLASVNGPWCHLVNEFILRVREPGRINIVIIHQICTLLFMLFWMM